MLKRRFWRWHQREMQRSGRRRKARANALNRRFCRFEALEDRVLLSVSRSVEAFENATVQPAGVRPGDNGQRFLNIEGSNAGQFASYGVVRFDTSLLKAEFDATFGAGNWKVESIELQLDQSNASFTANGLIGILFTGDDSTSITPGASTLLYPFWDGEFNDFADITVYVFEETATGFEENHELFRDGAASGPGAAAVRDDFLSDAVTTLLLVDQSEDVAATYAGITHATLDGPRLVVTAGNLDATSPIDLQLGTVNAPSAAVPGEVIEVTWDVFNVGQQINVVSVEWADGVYLSTDQELSGDDRLLAEVVPTNLSPIPIPVIPLYTTKANVELPSDVQPGEYYLLVKADNRNRVNESNEENNIRASVPIDITPPTHGDLIVETLNTPSEGVFGKDITLAWTAKNAGNESVDRLWSDGVWLSSDMQFGNSDDVRLATQPANEFAPLAPDVTYTQMATLTIPFDGTQTAGTYYLFVQLDENDDVPESDESNNLGFAQIAVTLPPPAELLVSNIDAPLEALSGQTVPISWTLTNQGPADVTGTFLDRILISTDALVGDDQLLGEIEFSGTIPSGQSITRTHTVTLPSDFSGARWFVIHTDALDQVFESDNANNIIIDDTAMSVTPAPFPSLEVTEVIAPPNAFSGREVLIEWFVSNVGTGPTTSSGWFDQVYLSTNDSLDGADVLLGAANNASYLDVGQSYRNSLVATLPNGIDDDFYFIVVTDGGDSEVGGPTDVDLTPPPDLRVTKVLAPGTAFSGQPVAIDWTITNEGPGETRSSSWRDEVYLSTDDMYDGGDKLLATVAHSGALNPGQQYDASATVSLPVDIKGDYFFIVRTDAGNEVFEHVFEENNSGFRDPATHIELTPPPDLEVELVDAPTSATASRALTVNYRVSNFGSTVTPNSSWEDRLYLSTDDVFDFGSDILLQSRAHFGALEIGAGYDASFTTTLANDRVGTFYAFVVTDFGDAVFELDNDNNVDLDPEPIAISSQPADLVVSDFSAPSSAQAGGSILVSWSIENIGVGDTAVPTWFDRLILSPDPMLGDNDIVLTTQQHTGLLDPGQAYSVENLLVQIPFAVTPGTYYLFVTTDSSNSVFEGNSEGNNDSTAIPLVVSRQTSDLQVTRVDAPSAGESGQKLSISWIVENFGIAATNANYWHDDVFLSVDDNISADDIHLGRVQHSNMLAPGGTYTATHNFDLPRDLFGNFLVLVRTDATGLVIEGTGEANNDGGTNERTIVTLSRSPDLTVTSVDAPAESFSGQRFTLSWTVQNVGPGVADNSWFDAVYLSRDQIFDRGSDVYLDFANRPTNLASGENYLQTQSFEIPSGLAGPFWVFVVADSGDHVKERLGEDNNVEYDLLSMQVKLPPPADLVAGMITIPPDSNPGQSATISYTVHNQGQNPARGRWIDSIYISADDQWDVNDPLFGRVEHNGDVAPDGGSYSESLTAALPGVLPGNYHVIVRTDIRNWIPERNEENNLAATLDTFEIDVPELQLGVPVRGQLRPGSPMYYKVAVAAGETLVVTLESEATDAVNEVYVALGRVPTRSDFDFSFSAALAADQRVVVPTTQAGTYYIAAFGGGPETNITGSGDGTEVGSEVNLKRFTVPVTPGPDPQSSVQVDLDWSFSGGTLGGVDPPSFTVFLQGELGVQILRFVEAAGTGGNFHNTLHIDGQVWQSAVDDGVLELEILVGATLNPYIDFATLSIEYAYPTREFTLLADRVDFTVFDESFGRGGNVGNLTIQLNGAKFDQSLNARLVGASVDRPAIQMWHTSDVRAYATFDLRGLAPGKYDVVVEKSDGGRATIAEGLEVVNGGGGTNVPQIIAPGNVGRNRGYSFTVTWGNDGLNDIEVPLLWVGNTVPFGTSPGSFELGTQHLFLGVASGDGPLGILRPGQGGSRTFYSFSDNSAGAHTVFVDRTTKLSSNTIDWNALRPSLIPSGMSDEEFEPIFQQLIRQVGSTSGEYLAMLSKNASLLSGSPTNLRNVDALLSIEVNRAWSMVSLSISGFLAEKSLAGLIGRNLLAENLTTNETYTAIVLADGSFTFPGLLEGDYRISVPGYDTSTSLGDVFSLTDSSSISELLVTANSFDIIERLLQLGFDEEDAATIASGFYIEGGIGQLSANGIDALATLNSESSARLITAIDDNEVTPELVLLARTILLQVASWFTQLGAPFAASHLVHFLFGNGSSIDYGARSYISTIAKYDFAASFSHRDAAKLVEPSVRSYLEERLRSTGSLPGSVTFNEIGIGRPAGPNFYLPGQQFYVPPLPLPILDLIGGFGDMGGDHTGEVVSITTRREGKRLLFDATIRYLWRDTYTFGNDYGASIFDTAAYYLERIARVAAPFATSITIEDKIQGAVEAPDDPDDEEDIDRQTSRDPNDILGPNGFGDEQWVSVSQRLNYTIQFENDPVLAMAPAQVVRITQQLDSDLDFRTFRLGDFSFGSLVIDMPDNRAFYTDRIDLTATLGIFVDVTAGINVATGEAFWELRSFDPATGDLPIDALKGILPPNLTSPEGEGFVSYSVRGKSTAQSGDVVDALATIVFDINEPIDTPPIFNTLDSGVPTSSVNVLPAAVDETTFTISWSGMDDENGSGLAGYDIYVSEDGGPFAVFLSNTTLTSAQFVGEHGKQYAFYSLARDNAGNVETVPASPDAITRTPLPPDFVAPTVATTVVQKGLTQRSFVDGLQLDFSECVNLGELIGNGTITDAITLTNLGINADVDSDQLVTLIAAQFQYEFDGDSGLSRLTWSLDEFAGGKSSLGDGYYRLVLDASTITDLAGNPLDGAGTPGSDFVFDFHRLAGDTDGNMVVDSADMDIVNAALGAVPTSTTWNENANLDRDGRITVRDRVIVARGDGAQITPPAPPAPLVAPGLPGDFNGNGAVDAADYVVWRKNLGRTSAVPALSGDGNSNGVVDGGDYLVWRQNFGRSISDAPPVDGPVSASAVTAAADATMLATEARDHEIVSGASLSAAQLGSNSRSEYQGIKLVANAARDVVFGSLAGALDDNGGRVAANRHSRLAASPRAKFTERDNNLQTLRLNLVLDRIVDDELSDWPKVLRYRQGVHPEFDDSLDEALAEERFADLALISRGQP